MNQLYYEILNENSRNIVDAICGGSITDKFDDELEELIEKLGENDSHFFSLSHHGRNIEPKNVKGLEPKNEKILTIKI